MFPLVHSTVLATHPYPSQCFPPVIPPTVLLMLASLLSLFSYISCYAGSPRRWHRPKLYSATGNPLFGPGPCLRGTLSSRVPRPKVWQRAKLPSMGDSVTFVDLYKDGGGMHQPASESVAVAAAASPALTPRIGTPQDVSLSRSCCTRSSACRFCVMTTC